MENSKSILYSRKPYITKRFDYCVSVGICQGAKKFNFQFGSHAINLIPIASGDARYDWNLTKNMRILYFKISTLVQSTVSHSK